MKYFLINMVSLIFIYSGSPLFAHGTHDENNPVEEDEVIELAERRVATMAKKGKIDKSWEGIKANKPEKKKFKKGEEWVVTFDNPAIKDEKKKKIFVFVSLAGKVLALNYTGH